MKLTKLFLPLFVILFYFAFAWWYFTDTKITTWGKTELTTKNFIESYYWTKRDLFWQNSLNRIHNLNHQPLKILLLEKYQELIPVDQWWSPIRKHKVNALYSLLETYQQQQNWPALEKYSQEFIKINPTNADPWYYLGNSQTNQNQDPTEAYEQALSIDATHLPTIETYADYLFNQGQYHQAYQIIEPYLNRIHGQDQICFYWGHLKFTANQRFCAPKNQPGIYTLPINTDNPNHTMIRLDPPQGNIHLKRIEFVSLTKQNKLIKDFSSWTLSRDLKASPNNLFYSIGTDPHLYTTLPDSIKLSDYNQLLVYANTQITQNPIIQQLQDRLKTKITLEDHE